MSQTKQQVTFYRRSLPDPPCTAFSSPAGRKLFDIAYHEGFMESYFPLSEQFTTQDEVIS